MPGLISIVLYITLYETITGRPPFEGASTTDILMQIVEKEPVPPQKASTLFITGFTDDRFEMSG